MVCRDPLTADRVECRGCRTPCHRACWDYVGSCSIYGCGKRSWTPMEVRIGPVVDMTVNRPSIQDFKISLLDAIEWHQMGRLGGSGTTPPLRSRELDPQMPHLWSAPNDPAKPFDRAEIVRSVIRKRRDTLLQKRLSGVFCPAALEGRLVVFDFDSTLKDGAAELASSDYFDADNVPAWDTWVAYVAEDTPFLPSSWQFSKGYLISWAPPEVAPQVERGIAVNPENCIGWAISARTAFTEELRRDGLLL